MWKQVRVQRAGVAALLLVLGVVGTRQSASVQVPIIITLPTIGETTLFSDNFDSYPAGSFPSAGGWEVVWGGTGQNLIVSDPSVSKPNSFQLWGSPNWSSVIQRKFSTNAPIIGYEFSIRIEKVGTGGPGREESPGFFRREAATWGGYYARVFFDHDTRRIEGEGKVPLGMWSPQTWYKVKVVLDRRTNLYSVWIDGRLAGQNIRTEGDCYQINALALFSGHPGVKVWYDDVRVFTVAEGADSGLRATLQTSRGCGAGAVFQIGEPMQATFRVEGTGQAYVRLLNILPTETTTVIQGTVNRGETTTIPGTAGEPAGSRMLRLQVWENILEFLSGRQPATTVECAFAVGAVSAEKEYKVKVLRATWEDPTVMVDPPSATMVLLEGSPTGRPGETLNLAWLPGQLRWDTDWPRPAAGHDFRIWVGLVPFWGTTYEAVVRWERISQHFVSAPDAPSGPSEGRSGESLAFSLRGGACSEPGHLVEFRLDWGDGTFSEWLNVFTLMFSPPTHAWAKEGNYLVRAQTRCAVDTSIVSAWSPPQAVSIRSAPVPTHTVSAPPAPSGPGEGEVGETLTFNLGYEITCNQGHGVEYQFDWGDGTSTGWGSLSPVAPSHAWTIPGTYEVKARARCTRDQSVVSTWSPPKTVVIKKTLTLFPKQDVMVASSAYETRKYGVPPYESQLGVLFDPRYHEERTLIQFDTSVIPFGAKVLSVRLRMALYNPHSEHRNSDVISVYRVQGPWQDTTVTWKTRPPDPPYGANADAWVELKGYIHQHTWIEWDLTEAVKRGGFPAYGWLLVGGRKSDWGSTTLPGVATFFSIEGGTMIRDQDYRPRLIVVYTQ